MAAEIKRKDHPEAKSLEKMTVKELKAVALEIPRSVAVQDMKKEELIALIRQSRGLEEEGPKKKEKKAPVRLLKNKEEIKATIRKLKQLRIEAQERHDKKGTDQLRRRIGRMKKISRRLAAR